MPWQALGNEVCEVVCSTIPGAGLHGLQTTQKVYSGHGRQAWSHVLQEEAAPAPEEAGATMISATFSVLGSV